MTVRQVIDSVEREIHEHQKAIKRLQKDKERILSFCKEKEGDKPCAENRTPPGRKIAA